jgi:hypothetical protein
VRPHPPSGTRSQTQGKLHSPLLRGGRFSDSSYNRGMRLVKVGIVVAVVSAIFAIFAWTSSPHDDLPRFRPFIQTQHDGYVTQTDATGSHLVYERKLRFKRYVLLAKGKAMVKGAPRGSKVYFQTGNGDVMCIIGSPFHKLYARGHEPPPNSFDVITYTKELKWNQVLWVRLTHLGSNPFTNKHSLV